jgi:serine/threonine protein kinase
MFNIEQNSQVGNYVIQKQLGVGSFATVYLCTAINGKAGPYAVKVVPKSNTDAQQLLCRGHKILQSIHSNSFGPDIDKGKQHIVDYIDTVETNLVFGVVLELIPGVELFDFVLANHRVVDGIALGLDESVARTIIRQILLGNDNLDSHSVHTYSWNRAWGYKAGEHYGHSWK